MRAYYSLKCAHALTRTHPRAREQMTGQVTVTCPGQLMLTLAARTDGLAAGTDLTVSQDAFLRAILQRR